MVALLTLYLPHLFPLTFTHLLLSSSSSSSPSFSFSSSSSSFSPSPSPSPSSSSPSLGALFSPAKSSEPSPF
jgi:hypothetical protein